MVRVLLGKVWVGGERVVAGLLLRGGRVEAVLGSVAAVRRASRSAGVPVTDLEGRWIVPGLVNAHAHLELSGLAATLQGDRGFVAWIQELMGARARRGPGGLRADAARGAQRCLETGTTTVGDVDSSGAVLALRSDEAPRLRVYREVLDAGDPDRAAAALGRVGRRLAPRRTRSEGISPHAPLTTSAALLAGAAAIRARRGLAATVHWSETAEEVRWLREGSGPFGALLSRSPGRSGLDLLEEHGFLGPDTSLVHGNHPLRGEPARIAAAGAVLVHCPGAHLFFGRAPFPWRRYRRAGVRLALGTDSLAGNADLDMFREMALVRGECPWLAPEEVWRMATTDAARALGLAGRVGELREGAEADYLLLESELGDIRALREELTAGRVRLVEVRVADRRRRGRPSPA